MGSGVSGSVGISDEKVPLGNKKGAARWAAPDDLLISIE
jgi:hypothetical protein